MLHIIGYMVSMLKMPSTAMLRTRTLPRMFNDLLQGGLTVHAGGSTVLASGAKDNKIRLWTPSGTCLAIGDGHSGAVSALAFSRKSSKFLVSGGVDKILKVSTFAQIHENITACWHPTLPSDWKSIASRARCLFPTGIPSH